MEFLLPMQIDLDVNIHAYILHIIHCYKPCLHIVISANIGAQYRSFEICMQYRISLFYR